MKKITVVLAVLLIFIVGLTATGCIVKGTTTGEDAGDRTTRTYDYTDFTEIEIGNAFSLEVIPSDEYSITITAGENILNKLDVTKTGKRLEIDLDGWFFNLRGDMKATVTMPALEGLYLSGATRTVANGFSSDSDFRAEVSGASTLNMDLEAGKCDIEISGASRVKGNLTAADTDFDVSGASTLDLTGSGSDTSIVASGASRIELQNFTVEDADIDLSGASSGTVNASGKLDANLSGASTLNYTGGPDLGTINTTGGSTFREK